MTFTDFYQWISWCSTIYGKIFTTNLHSLKPKTTASEHSRFGPPNRKFHTQPLIFWGINLLWKSLENEHRTPEMLKFSHWVHQGWTAWRKRYHYFGYPLKKLTRNPEVEDWFRWVSSLHFQVNFRFRAVKNFQERKDSTWRKRSSSNHPCSS